MNIRETLTLRQRDELIGQLEQRFHANLYRHPKQNWASVASRLVSADEKIYSVYQMERTGGEPDVVELEEGSDAIVFVDCSAESPTGRRSLCYDRAAWEARKTAKPKGNALEMASAMGIKLLTEEQYLALQRFGPFDTKTSSWLWTPPSIRTLGGALFGDHRFGRTFIYHNGAESYYASRGFRGWIML
ncbi:MAG: DUF4256 domain-containing protein [Chitinophagales bacterium]|nr:DUF4256 domain-containing protein [Chitinophagales bacterium]MDW8427296.1 DUF4256 domain-containing protein [Chitinophagales bacterium]